MRTISADLLAAQKAPSRVPYVPVTVENAVAGVRRMDFTTLDTTANTVARHDVAVAGDNAVIRVRMQAGGVKYQRVTTPGSGPWNSWTDLATGKGAQVACAAKGARVLVVYTDAAGTDVRYRESTDYGVTFSVEARVTLAGAAVQDLACAYKDETPGDCAVAWALATSVQLNKRASGSWAGAATWTHSAASLNGIALAYVFDWSIALTGTETGTTKPTLWTFVYGDGVDAPVGTWSTLRPQLQAEASASVTFAAPFLVFTDTYRLTVAELATYTGGATRVFRMWLHPSLTYVQGAYTWRAPAPANSTSAQGFAMAATAAASGGWLYESEPLQVQRAARDQVTLDVTADVLALDLHESTSDAAGVLELNNDAGQYAGPPAPIAVGNRVNIAAGYETASGNQASTLADFWIAAYEYRRSGGRSVLRLQLESGWHLLRRSRQRTQIIHAAGVDTYRTIAIAIAARAGLALVTNGASSRSGSVTPAFSIHSQTSGNEALRRLLAFVADRVIMRDAADALFTEPLAAETADYTFGTDHPLSELALRGEPPPVEQARVFGAGAYGEASDLATAQHGLSTPGELRDLTSASGATAAATATAHLRQRALDQRHGVLVVPPCVGLQVLDVVGFADAYVSASTQTRRVAAIRWRLDRTKEATVYEQHITLGTR